MSEDKSFKAKDELRSLYEEAKAFIDFEEMLYNEAVLNQSFPLIYILFESESSLRLGICNE